MRVTGNRMIEVAAAATSNAQSRIATSSEQVTSGMRVERPSDDPTAWVAAERAKLHRSLVEGSTKAVQTSRDRLDQVDGALATIGDVMSQVRTLAVEGASDTYSPSDRKELAAEVRALLQTGLGAANVRAADGEYLLAGAASQTAPFDPAGNYVGDASTRRVAITDDTTTPISIPGTELTAASGVDVLPLINKVADALAANDPSTVAGLLGQLQTAIEQVGLARTRTGGAMNVLDATKAAHDDLKTSLSETISRAVETDTVSAASDLAKASQALEASRAVTSHLINLLQVSK